MQQPADDLNSEIREYEVIHSSRVTSSVTDQPINETSTTRLIIRPMIIENNVKNPDAKIKIELIHQRKTLKSSWQDDPGTSLSSIKAGEQIKLSLNSASTLKLYQLLRDLYLVSEKSGSGYESKFVVSPADEMISTSSKRKSIIVSLLEQGHSEEFWEELERIHPELADNFSDAKIQKQRRRVLTEFRNNLALDLDESKWQEFFSRNTWIFGYGLNYQILKPLQEQPGYGGLSVSGKGIQKGDYLVRTEANVKFTVLLEIKKPSTPLLGGKEYRNGAWELGEHLIGGVSQLQANCRTWEIDGARSPSNVEDLASERTYTVSPKSILVIGDTSQLIGKRNARTTFELFRRNLANPEIITYDELYERAAYIIGERVDKSTDYTHRSPDGDIPF